MKAITIKQPWASLIVHGIKDIENRTWRTNYRGRVLIHAAGSHGKKFSVDLTDAQMKAAFGTIAKETMFGNLPFGTMIVPKGRLPNIVSLAIVPNAAFIWASVKSTLNFLP